MKINENNEAFPPYKYFTDVEEKFLNFTPNCRVLPARYFNEPNTFFSLKQKYEPGEHKNFPKGGFEICDVNGGIYNFGLNEVVVHPFHLNMNKYFSTTLNLSINKEKIITGVKGKRGRPKKDPSQLKILPVYVPAGGKRGRKPLSEEEKAKRNLLKVNKVLTNPERKRGRPRKS